MIARSFVFAAVAFTISTPMRAQAPVTAFVDVAMIPMDRERVLTGQTVIVQGDRITAIGPVRRVSVPANAVRVDGRGKYLMPGLADVHVHLRHENDKAMMLFLANGITTIRDMHSGNRDGVGQDGADSIRLNLRRRVTKGELIGPRLYLAGDPAEASAEAAATSVAEMKEDGHDFVKMSLRDQATLAMYDSIKIVAQRSRLRIAGHVPVHLLPLDSILRHGWGSIEHLTGYYEHVLKYSPDGIIGHVRMFAAMVDTAAWLKPDYHPTKQLREVAAKTKRAGVWNTPTVKTWLVFSPRDSAAEALMHPNAKPIKQPSAGKDELLYMPMRRVMERLQEFSYWTVKALHDAGAGLLLGTDVGDYTLTDVPPGFGLVKELRELVKAGLSPYQALETGTRNVATFLGTLDSTGTVAVGKRADLVLLSGNPLKDVGLHGRPRWRDGRRALASARRAQRSARQPTDLGEIRPQRRAPGDVALQFSTRRSVNSAAYPG